MGLNRHNSSLRLQTGDLPNWCLSYQAKENSKDVRQPLSSVLMRLDYSLTNWLFIGGWSIRTTRPWVMLSRKDGFPFFYFLIKCQSGKRNGMSTEIFEMKAKEWFYWRHDFETWRRNPNVHNATFCWSNKWPRLLWRNGPAYQKPVIFCFLICILLYFIFKGQNNGKFAKNRQNQFENCWNGQFLASFS